MSTVTFTTQHKDGFSQQHLIAYLQQQGATVAFRDNIHKTTQFTCPTPTFTKQQPSLKPYLLEVNTTPIKHAKTELAKHQRKEYKWCKSKQGNCSECGLRDGYCSRRPNQKT